MTNYTFSSGMFWKMGFGSYSENHSVEVALLLHSHFMRVRTFEDYDMSSSIGNLKFDAELRYCWSLIHCKKWVWLFMNVRIVNNGGTLDFVDRDISCLGQTLQLVKKIKMNKPTQVIGWQDNLGGKYRFCAKSSEEAPSNSWYGFWCFSQNLFFLPRAHCRVLSQTSIIRLAIGWQSLEVGSYLEEWQRGNYCIQLYAVPLIHPALEVDAL